MKILPELQFVWVYNCGTRFNWYCCRGWRSLRSQANHILCFVLLPSPSTISSFLTRRNCQGLGGHWSVMKTSSSTHLSKVILFKPVWCWFPFTNKVWVWCWEFLPLEGFRLFPRKISQIWILFFFCRLSVMSSILLLFYVLECKVPKYLGNSHINAYLIIQISGNLNDLRKVIKIITKPTNFEISIVHRKFPKK